MFKLVLTAVVAMFALAGCNTEASDAQVRRVLSQACPAVAQAFTYYSAIASAGVLSQRTMDRVELAKHSSDLLCANPEQATVTSVLTASALVYSSVRLAIEEAKVARRRSDDTVAVVGYSGDLRNLERLNARLKKELARHAE